jgi:hypothetical protein
MSQEEDLPQTTKKALSPEEQREKDLRPFQSISRTTAVLHFFWERLMSFVVFFGYLFLFSLISNWLFGWDVLSSKQLLIFAVIGSLLVFSIQMLRKKFRSKS